MFLQTKSVLLKEDTDRYRLIWSHFIESVNRSRANLSQVELLEQIQALQLKEAKIKAQILT